MRVDAAPARARRGARGGRPAAATSRRDTTSGRGTARGAGRRSRRRRSGTPASAARDLGRQLGRDALVGVEAEHPVAASPRRARTASAPGSPATGCAITRAVCAARDLDGGVARAAVDDDDLVAPGDAVEARPDLRRLVLADDGARHARARRAAPSGAARRSLRAAACARPRDAHARRSRAIRLRAEIGVQQAHARGRRRRAGRACARAGRGSYAPAPVGDRGPNRTPLEIEQDELGAARRARAPARSRPSGRCGRRPPRAGGGTGRRARARSRRARRRGAAGEPLARARPRSRAPVTSWVRKKLRRSSPSAAILDRRDRPRHAEAARRQRVAPRRTPARAGDGAPRLRERHAPRVHVVALHVERPDRRRRRGRRSPSAGA